MVGLISGVSKNYSTTGSCCTPFNDRRANIIDRETKYIPPGQRLSHSFRGGKTRFRASLGFVKGGFRLYLGGML